MTDDKKWTLERKGETWNARWILVSPDGYEIPGVVAVSGVAEGSERFTVEIQGPLEVKPGRDGEGSDG
jgi:predicted N-acetyltransferase YhbS